MIDWHSMSENQIRQELKDAGIEPVGVEVDTSTLTVWMNGTRKDREGHLVPRKFTARRLETVVRQIKKHQLERASD